MTGQSIRAPGRAQPPGAPVAAGVTSAGTLAKPRPRRPRRWLRLVVPPAVVVLLWIVIAIAHVYQEPNLRDAGTLSPVGAGRHGSSQLARRLTAQGVSVVRVTSSDAAITAAQGDATIFVPAPDLLDYGFMSRLDGTPGRHRVVLVRPGLTGARPGQPVWLAHSRWATGRATPGCRAPYATGPATVRRDGYGWSPQLVRPAPTVCYGGSVIAVDNGDDELILVGATEPFRNDRLAEAANAALATGLLAEHGRVVWVDVHGLESQAAPPDLPGLPQYRRGDRDRSDTGGSLFGSFPAQLWAVLLLLLLAATLLGIAQARRLGPPVAEPLPVLVPAAETVTGRGRLYHRIRARQASLDTLRAAAVARLARALDPLARVPERRLGTEGPARADFLVKVGAWAGLPPQTVRAVLFGPSPADDEELVRAAADLDRLVAAVLTARPRPDAPQRHQGAPTKPTGGAE
jgi:hypothetical protein